MMYVWSQNFLNKLILEFEPYDLDQAQPLVLFLHSFSLLLTMRSRHHICFPLLIMFGKRQATNAGISLKEDYFSIVFLVEKSLQGVELLKGIPFLG